MIDRHTVPYRYFKDVLDNGLRVITVEMPYMHAAEVALYVKSGSRDETIENNGVSHFLEHMFFRGSSQYPSSFSLNQKLETIGDGLIANTFREFTCFWSKIEPTALEKGISIFGDVFTKPIFEEIETERKIILIELLEDFDSDGEIVDIDNISRPFIWPGNPLGFSVIGTKENIEKFTRDDLISHFNQFYTPPNMVLCVTGDVSRTEVLESARQYFGHAQGEASSAPPPVQMAQEFPLSKFIFTESSKVDVQLSFRALGERHPDIKKLFLIQRILDDGISSRLQKSICEEKGLAYDISAALDCYSDTGVFDVDVSVPEEQVKEIIMAILYELKLLKEEVITEAELTKIKDRSIRDYEFNFDNLRQMSIQFGEAELLYDLKTPEESMQEIMKITAEDLQEVAKQVFNSKNLNLIILGPYTDEQQREIKELLRSRPI
jgi:predicted Zn-dependent peptidase